MTASVADLQPGARGLLIEVRTDAAQQRRLAELGLRPGAVVDLVQRAAGGACVVGIDGARIAVDRRTSRLLRVGECP